jgi:hypothetical protein
MVEGGRKRIPGEALINLRRRLDTLPPRHPERTTLLQNAAELYGVSRATLYRQLQQHVRPKSIRRVDRGKPRKLPASELERYCEIIAALKLRTSNKKGRHLSKNRAIELLEGEGVETPDGLVRISPGMLTRTTVNRYLRDWGYDHVRMTRGACGGALPGAPFERALALRSQPVRPQRGREAALVRTWSRQPDADALQRRR